MACDVASTAVTHFTDLGQGCSTNVCVDEARGKCIAGANGVGNVYWVAAMTIGPCAIREEASVRSESDGDEAALRRKRQQRIGGVGGRSGQCFVTG